MQSVEGQQPVCEGAPLEGGPLASATPPVAPPMHAGRGRRGPVVDIDGRWRAQVAAAAGLVDGAAVLAAGLAAHYTAHQGLPLLPGQIAALGFLGLLAVNLLQLARLTATPSALAGLRAAVAVPVVLSAVLLGLPPAATALGLSGGTDWRWLARWAALAVVLTLCGRLTLAAALARLGRARLRPVLVVGDPARTPAVLDMLGGEVVALTVGVERAAELLRAGQACDVILALPWDDQRRVAACLARLKEFPVNVHLFPDRADPFLAGHGLSLWGGVPMAQMARRPLALAGMGAVLKAIEDVTLGALALALVAPVMLAVAVAIKLDSPGPVLFRQKRYGFNNQVFMVFKFRSMVVQPPKACADSPTPEAGDPAATVAALPQASRDDPRVTRVGRFIRRTSLDELPQLFNVLNGTMSLVGPRPHAVEHQTFYEQLVDEYRARHRMKPGITGWAQVHGYRGETRTLDLMKRRVEYDLYYIEHWSLLLDLWILLLTPISCLRGKNAY